MKNRPMSALNSLGHCLEIRFKVYASEIWKEKMFLNLCIEFLAPFFTFRAYLSAKPRSNLIWAQKGERLEFSDD